MNRKKNQNIKILYFWADWCAPSIRLQELLSDLKPTSAIPIEIRHIDAERRWSLRKKYKVKIIPTTVFLKENKEVDRVVGAYHLNKYQSIVSKLNKLNKVSG